MEVVTQLSTTCGMPNCPAWDLERQKLESHVGSSESFFSSDLSLQKVIAAMLAKEESWRTAVSFCEAVITKKAAERVRERTDPARRRTRRIGGYCRPQSPITP